MKRIFSIIFLGSALTALSCQQLQWPELDSSNSINALKCYVYTGADWTGAREVDLLSGTYRPDLGAVNYTFSSNDFSREELSRCRIEASIPSTASIVELNGAGEEIGSGIGGSRDLYNTTVYFKVVAADGSEKSYQLSLRYQ